MQVPGVSARSTNSVALKATPSVPAPLERPAAVKATAVPWPLSSWMVVPPPTFCDAAEMRPENSALVASMPLSMTPIVTPAPVAPAL